MWCYGRIRGFEAGSRAGWGDPPDGGERTMQGMAHAFESLEDYYDRGQFGTIVKVTGARQTGAAIRWLSVSVFAPSTNQVTGWK